MGFGPGPQMSMPNNGMGMGMPMTQAPMQQAPVEAPPAANVPPTITSGGFKATTGAAEFIPQGMVVKTQEQFPDLDLLDEPVKSKKGKKGKKGRAVVVAKEEVKAVTEEEVFDESTPWKGRPSTFFVM